MLFYKAYTRRQLALNYFNDKSINLMAKKNENLSFNKKNHSSLQLTIIRRRENGLLLTYSDQSTVN